MECLHGLEWIDGCDAAAAAGDAVSDVRDDWEAGKLKQRGGGCLGVSCCWCVTAALTPSLASRC